MKNKPLTIFSSLFLAFCVITEFVVLQSDCLFKEVSFFFTWIRFTDYGVIAVDFFLIPLFLNMAIVGYGLFYLLVNIKYQKILFLCSMALFFRVLNTGISIPISNFNFYLLEATAGYNYPEFDEDFQKTNETSLIAFYVEENPITIFKFGTLGAVVNGVFRPAKILNKGEPYEECNY